MTATIGHGTYRVTGSNSTGLLHRAPALVNHAEALARLAGASPKDERALIIATYLVAGAAIEGLLQEAAHDHDRRHPDRPALYTRKFRRGPAADKYKQVMGTDVVPKALADIWDVRTALTHTEPDKERTKTIIKDLTVQGAAEAAAHVRELQAAVALKFAEVRP